MNFLYRSIFNRLHIRVDYLWINIGKNEYLVKERHPCLKSGGIPNKWGWPDSPQPSSNLVVSPTSGCGQTHLNPAAILWFPQQVGVARFTSTQQQSCSIPNKWGWPDSPQPSSNLVVSPTSGVTRLTSTQQQSCSIPNKWGWPDSPQPSSNLVYTNTPLASVDHHGVQSTVCMDNELEPSRGVPC